jgi:hypothetical protein
MLFGGTFRELRVSLMNVTHLACNESHGPFGEVGRAPASTHHCRNRSHELVSKHEFVTRINFENHVDLFQVFIDEY